MLSWGLNLISASWSRTKVHDIVTCLLVKLLLWDMWLEPCPQVAARLSGGSFSSWPWKGHGSRYSDDDPLMGLDPPQYRDNQYVQCCHGWNRDGPGASCTNWIWRGRLGRPKWGRWGVSCWVCGTAWRESYLFWMDRYGGFWHWVEH